MNPLLEQHRMFDIGSRHTALCADGKHRRALIIGHPDTYFTVPARVKVRGVTVTGYLYWHGTGQTDLRFSANQWMRNGHLLRWEGTVPV